jgi:hypothetical protein
MFNSNLTGLIAVSLIFGGPVLCFLAGIIVNGWVKATRNREETDLKHRLVEADFSADEIARILNAGPAKRAAPRGKPRRKRTMGQRSESADSIIGATFGVLPPPSRPCPSMKSVVPFLDSRVIASGVWQSHPARGALPRH